MLCWYHVAYPCNSCRCWWHLLMHVLLAIRGAETLRSPIPTPVTLLNAQDKQGTTLATSECSEHSKYSHTSAPLLARWLLWPVWLSPRCRSPGGNKRDGRVAVYEPGTRRRGWVCECLLLSRCWETGTPLPARRPLGAAPPAQRWTRGSRSNRCLVHRSCHGSTLQIHAAQESGDVGPRRLFCPTQKARSHPGNSEQILEYSIYLYIST